MKKTIITLLLAVSCMFTQPVFAMEQNNSNDSMGEIIPASRARNVNKYTDISTVSSKYGSFVVKFKAIKNGRTVYVTGSTTNGL